MSAIPTEDILMGYEIPGAYDGIAIWIMNDGSLINRFAGTGTRREEIIQSHISSMLLARETAPGPEAAS